MPLLRPAVVAALLLLGACSGEEAEPATAPTPSSTSSETASEPDPTPTGDPITFGSTDSRLVIGCFPEGHRDFVVYDQMSVDRPITLLGLTTDAEAMTVSRTWVSALAADAVPESGAWDLADRGKVDILGWDTKAPLEEATLAPGDYTFLAQVRLVPDRRLDDLDLRWSDGTTSGTSSYDFQGRTRSGGC